MEANREAALHYLELAEKAIRTDEIERAIRFINKSEDLYPTKKAKGKRDEDSFHQSLMHFRSSRTNKEFHFSIQQ